MRQCVKCHRYTDRFEKRHHVCRDCRNEMNQERRKKTSGKMTTWERTRAIAGLLANEH